MIEAIVIGIMAVSALMAWGAVQYLEAGIDKPHDAFAVICIWWAVGYVPGAFWWLTVSGSACAC